MIEILNQYSDFTKYEEFVSKNKYGHFMQSIEWAKLKVNWDYNVIIIKNSNNIIIGSMLILIRKIFKYLPYTIMYAPRAPIYDFDNLKNEWILSSLLQTAKKIANKNKSYIFKIDPNINILNEKINLKKFGFKLNNTGKNFEYIQPRFVFRLEIANNSIETIFNNFLPKTRYNIKYAQKKDVYIKICNCDMLPIFYKLMLETSIRDKFIPRNLEYFQNMMKLFKNNIRLYMAFTKNDIPIAGAIAINYSKKTWYLYGASSNNHRNLMPNYLLQYEMIKWAIDTKCCFYDFRGVSGDINNKTNPLYGLYRFKKGFNGQLIEFIGEYDLVINKYISFLFNNFKRIYILLRRKLYLKNKIKNS